MNVTVYQGKNFVLTNEHVLRKATTREILANVLVLVPDRFTLQAERILLKYRPQLLNTRVITFSMLYRLVASELNQGQEPQVLDKTSAVLSLWKAIRQVQNQLVWFKTSAGHYDFAEKMYNTINQMRSSCVDFASLATTAKTAVAQKKYHDINLIYQAYMKILQNQTDSSGMLEYLVQHLAESQTVKTASVYVCGFPSLSPARLQVLMELCQHASSVTIGTSEPELNGQLSKFTHYQIPDAKPFTPVAKTVRCETERGEASVIAEQIVALIKQGVAPEEIVVLLTEFETMAPIWQVVAQKYQLPVNIDVGTKLSTTADAKYLRDLLELTVNDDAENTVAVLYNQCSGVADETVFELDNQIVKANLRARAVPAVKKLHATKNVRELCEQLKLMTQNEKLQNILDQIQRGCAGEDLNLREFINLFWTLCRATKISNIPSYINRVLIAPVNDWVPSMVKYLFIANCTLENFPQGQADDDILQEADLVATGITPTPKLQRERNCRRAEMLQTIPSVQITLSGTCDHFVPVAYEPYANFKWVAVDSPITVGQDLFFGKRRVNTTLLENYYSCPHLNFLQKGLRLSPRPIYKLAPNTVGSAIHIALQEYFTHHNLEQAVQTGIQALAYDYPPLTQNIAKEITFIIQRLTEIFAEGKFNLQTEVEKDVTRPLQHGLTLIGRVDRIDIADLGDNQHAYLVLDYKTGNVGDSVAKSIYLGKKLQLPVYASALKKLGKIAGAGYLPLSKGYADDEKSFQLKGFVNTDLKDLFPPSLISPGGKYYLSMATIDNLCRHANRLVDEAVEKIIAGDVKPLAVDEQVCTYCPIKNLCQLDENQCRDKGEKILYSFFKEDK